jgi:hypothetical protein
MTPVLGQKAAHLVGQRTQVFDQLRARPVQLLGLLLFDTPDRHEPHRGARGGFADRLGVIAVVLVAFHERLNELRIDQAHGMTKLGNLDEPSNGRCRRPPSPLATRQVGQKCRQLRPAHPFAQHRMSERIGAVEMEHALGKIDNPES